MRLKLPPKVKYILDILHAHGFEAYAVGGCVRDYILARQPDDWDITTSARPEEVKACFRRTVDTGIKHGTVTVMLDDTGFEVTTYRVDGEYTDGRHPDSVTYTSLLSEDLRRRDFTINAMAYNEEDGLVDLFGGMDDLQKKVIRCVGDPNERFDEDALRILRAVRFSAQLDFSIENETALAVSSHVKMLSHVSAERIQVELVKLITSKHPEAFRTLYTLGITKMILPEFDICMETPQNTAHHCYNVGEHIIHAMCECPDSKVLRLTMLLHDIGKPCVRWTDSLGRDHFKGHAFVSADMADGILRRLRFDNDTRRRVTTLIRWHDLRPAPVDGQVRRAMYTVGPDLFEDYLSVQWADNMAKSLYQRERKLQRIRDVYEVYKGIMERGDCLSLKTLAIGGRDLVALGVRGPEIGNILEASLLAVLENPSLNDRDILLVFARWWKEHDVRLM
ncbi:MAG: CCA tRNA nucleotidyltransferase [Lachnospiraceae bacterium]|nr:CCA tRNA nucleotidyltransferase [Lachnospiraceae bacterium]